jgi:hypothetical protein
MQMSKIVKIFIRLKGILQIWDSVWKPNADATHPYATTTPFLLLH